jgi:hypothetical protein
MIAAAHTTSKPVAILVLAIVLTAFVGAFMARGRLGGDLVQREPVRYFAVYVAAPLVMAATVAVILIGTLFSPGT